MDDAVEVPALPGISLADWMVLRAGRNDGDAAAVAAMISSRGLRVLALSSPQTRAALRTLLDDLDNVGEPIHEPMGTFVTAGGLIDQFDAATDSGTISTSLAEMVSSVLGICLTLTKTVQNFTETSSPAELLQLRLVSDQLRSVLQSAGDPAAT